MSSVDKGKNGHSATIDVVSFCLGLHGCVALGTDLVVTYRLPAQVLQRPFLLTTVKSANSCLLRFTQVKFEFRRLGKGRNNIEGRVYSLIEVISDAN